MAVVVIPLFAVYLCAPVVFQAYYQDSAREHAGTLKFFAHYVTYTRLPCRGWFDAGFEIEYQWVRGENPRTGHLCRAIDQDWVWYPDPRG